MQETGYTAVSEDREGDSNQYGKTIGTARSAPTVMALPLQ